MTVRRAVPDDAPVMLACVQEGFEGYRAFAPPGWEPPDDTRPEMQERLRAELAEETTVALIAEVDGEYAGHVTLVPARTPSPDGSTPDLHLRHLFVRRKHWGSGVARALHDALRPYLKGTSRLYTPAGHPRARRFYEREGWTLHAVGQVHPEMGLELAEYRRTD